MGLLQKKDTYFPSVWNDLFNNDWVSQPEQSYASRNLPKVNIANNEDHFMIELAAPGLKKEDFSLDVDDETLTISAHREEEKNEQEGNYTRKEFSYQTFKRSFTLPDNVVTDKISAKYEDGVVHIHIPKELESKKTKQRKISIS